MCPQRPTKLVISKARLTSPRSSHGPLMLPTLTPPGDSSSSLPALGRRRFCGFSQARATRSSHCQVWKRPKTRASTTAVFPLPPLSRTWTNLISKTAPPETSKLRLPEPPRSAPLPPMTVGRIILTPPPMWTTISTTIANIPVLCTKSHTTATTTLRPGQLILTVTPFMIASRHLLHHAALWVLVQSPPRRRTCTGSWLSFRREAPTRRGVIMTHQAQAPSRQKQVWWRRKAVRIHCQRTTGGVTAKDSFTRVILQLQAW